MKITRIVLCCVVHHIGILAVLGRIAVHSIRMQPIIYYSVVCLSASHDSEPLQEWMN